MYPKIVEIHCCHSLLLVYLRRRSCKMYFISTKNSKIIKNVFPKNGLILWIVKIISLENRKIVWINYTNSNTFHSLLLVYLQRRSCKMYFISTKNSKIIKNICPKNGLILWIVKIISLENRKWFWINYTNSNTFHSLLLVYLRRGSCKMYFISTKNSKIIKNICPKNYFGLIIQIQIFFMLKVLSDSKVCKKWLIQMFKVFKSVENVPSRA